MSDYRTPARLAFEDLVRTEIYLMKIVRKQHAWNIRRKTRSTRRHGTFR